MIDFTKNTFKVRVLKHLVNASVTHPRFYGMTVNYLAGRVRGNNGYKITKAEAAKKTRCALRKLRREKLVYKISKPRHAAYFPSGRAVIAYSVWEEFRQEGMA